jgi:hypothetical protein
MFVNDTLLEAHMLEITPPHCHDDAAVRYPQLYHPMTVPVPPVPSRDVLPRHVELPGHFGGPRDLYSHLLQLVMVDQEHPRRELIGQVV